MKTSTLIVLLCISFALNVIFYIHMAGFVSNARTHATFQQMNVDKDLLIRNIQDYFDEHGELPKTLEELSDISRLPTISSNKLFYYLLPEEKDTYLLMVSNTKDNYVVYEKRQLSLKNSSDEETSNKEM